jgi:hypothetical protein
MQMSDIHIPPKALEAGARAAYEEWRRQFSTGDDFARYEDWDDLSRFHKDEYREQARAACLAMIEEWPMWTINTTNVPGGYLPALILPLTEKTDDKA